MLTNDQAVTQIFTSVIPGIDGAKIDFMTVMIVVIGIYLIGLAFYAVKSLLVFSIEDGRLSVRTLDQASEDEFEKDRQHYNWLNQNDEKSDPFIRAVGNAKKQRLVSKWSKK